MKLFCLVKAKTLKRALTINILILPIRPACYRLQRKDMTGSSPGIQKSTSSQYDQVYGLTQIPQVVINIYYKLGPIADKTVVVGPSHVFSLRYTVRFLSHSRA